MQPHLSLPPLKSLLSALGFTLFLFPLCAQESVTTGEWVGRWEISVTDDFDSGRSRLVRQLVTSEAIFEITALPGGPLPDPNQTVRVAGSLSGRQLAVERWQPEPGRKAAATGCSTTGEQRIAVILVTTPNVRVENFASHDFWGQAFFGAGRSVDNYLREASFGKTWAAGTVVGPYALGAQYEGASFAYIRDAAIQAADAELDFRQYSRLFFVVPVKTLPSGIGGEGTLGCVSLSAPGDGPFTASATRMQLEGFDSPERAAGLALHELGHNLGLLHATTEDFGVEPLGPPGTVGPQAEYGDRFSIMGMARDALGIIAAPHRALLGWLEAGLSYRQVEADGTFVLAPYGAAGAGGKALRVRRGTGNNAWLWLEYRQPVGNWDVTLARVSTDVYRGTLVHYEEPPPARPREATSLLDFTPSATPNNFLDAELDVGKSWSDPYSNLTVTVTRTTSEGLEVGVQYSPAASCRPTLLPSRIDAPAAGTGGSFDVTAPAGCSWSVASNVPWLSSSGSGAGNGKVDYTVAATTSTLKRFGRLTVGGSAFAVVQAGIPGSVTALSPAAVSFPAAGGAGSFRVTTNVPEVQWVHGASTAWARVEWADSTGDGVVQYQVAANTSAAQRTCTISIAKEVPNGTPPPSEIRLFTITQAAGGPSASLLDWSQLQPQAMPEVRVFNGIAFDSRDSAGVLYGGQANAVNFGDTWSWNGSTWGRLSPVHNPGKRWGHAMVYDAARGEVLLFGGFGDGYPAYKDETWVWNGSDWIRRNTPVQPRARIFHSMVYDPLSQKVLLFGGLGWKLNPDGSSGPVSLNDTWTWDGSTWTQLVTPTAPSPRDGARLVYDPVRRETVLFGGGFWMSETVLVGGQFIALDVSTFYSDTWVWNGQRWIEKRPAHAPTARRLGSMVFHPELGLVVMSGGREARRVDTGPYLSVGMRDTWVWNGEDWTQVFPNTEPDAAYGYGMFWDDQRKQLVAHVAAPLLCADPSPKTFVLRPGQGALGLSPDAATSPAAGGEMTAAVTTGAPWTASTGFSWIRVLSGTPGQGNGSVRYAVDANPWALPRTGSIVIGPRSFPITQEAAADGLPSISDSGVTSAADSTPNLAAGGIISIYGGGLASTTRGAEVIPLPATLEGTSVEVLDGERILNAPLFFVSASQINAQMPFGLTGTSVQVRVRTARGVSEWRTVEVQAAAPRLFTWSMTGVGQAIAVHADWTLVDDAHPAVPGEVLVLFLNALGPVTPPLASGVAAGDGVNLGPLNVSAEPVYVTVGEVSVRAEWAGLTPTLVGLYQVNFKVPAVSGLKEISVQAGAWRSQSNVNIRVR